MARKDITVVAEPRSTRGKNEARRTRVGGMAPAVLYGAGGDSVAISVNPKDVRKILHSKTGHNTIFDVAVTGGRVHEPRSDDVAVVEGAPAPHESLLRCQRRDPLGCLGGDHDHVGTGLKE